MKPEPKSDLRDALHQLAAIARNHAGNDGGSHELLVHRVAELVGLTLEPDEIVKRRSK